MRGLRTFLSAVAILCGALLVAAWALSWMLLRVVDDGAVARGIARTTLENPAVTARLVDEVQSTTERELARGGVDLNALGLSDTLAGLLEAMVSSGDFRAALVAQVDAARIDLQAELSRPGRPEGPFVLSFDVSQQVNDRVDNLALIGDRLPDVALAPVEVEVVSAERFEQARTAYAGLDFARSYFGYAGAALILAGMLVSHRRQYVLAKFFLVVGVIGLIAFIVLTFAEPLTAAGWLPGIGEGSIGQFLSEVLSDQVLPGVASRVGLGALVSLGLAALAALLGWLIGPRGSR